MDESTESLPNCGYVENLTLNELIKLLSETETIAANLIQIKVIVYSKLIAQLAQNAVNGIEDSRLLFYIKQVVDQQLNNEFTNTIIKKFFYNNFLNVMLAIVKEFPECQEKTVADIKRVIQTYTQRGGDKNEKIWNLVRMFNVAFMIFMVFQTAIINANKTEESQTLTPEKESAFSSIFGDKNNSSTPQQFTGDFPMAQSEPYLPAVTTMFAPTLLIEKGLNDAVVTLVTTEVILAISNHSDPAIREIFGATNKLPQALQAIGESQRPTADITSLYGLTVAHQQTILTLYNVANNNYAQVFLIQVASVNNLLSECSSQIQLLHTFFGDSIVNIIEKYEPTSITDQESLKEIVKGLRKFLIANGFTEQGDGSFEPSLSHEERPGIEGASKNTQEKQPSLVMRGVAGAYRNLQVLVHGVAGETGEQAVKAAANAIIPSTLAKEAVKAEQIAQAKVDEESLKKEKLKQDIKFAKSQKGLLLRSLSELRKVSTALARLGELYYNPIGNTVTVYCNNEGFNYSIGILEFYRDAIISPKLEKAKELKKQDAQNWISQLTPQELTELQVLLSINDKITAAIIAFKLFYGGMFVALVPSQHNDKLMEEVAKQINIAFDYLKRAYEMNRPMQDVEDMHAASITAEEKQKYKERAEQYWENLKEISTAAVKGPLDLVAATAESLAFTTAQAALRIITGPIDAIMYEFNQRPYACIVIGSILGILVLYFSGVLNLTTLLARQIIPPTISIVSRVVGVIVGQQVIVEVIIRGKEMFGIERIEGYSGPESNLNNLLLMIFKISGVDSPCPYERCIEPLDSTGLVSFLIIGGLIVYYNRSKISTFGKVPAKLQNPNPAVPVIAPAPGGPVGAPVVPVPVPNPAVPVIAPAPGGPAPVVPLPVPNPGGGFNKKKSGISKRNKKNTSNKKKKGATKRRRSTIRRKH